MDGSGANQGRPRRSGRAKAWLAGIAILFAAGAWWTLRVGIPWLHGVQAYVYAFPLVVMDLTREVSTAVPAPGYVTAPANRFAVMTHYPDPSFKVIPRTGLDTLFAIAWADLDAKPLVLSVPDTGGRYYVIALFDMWSNVFGSIGKRTTGTGAGDFLIAGPGWEGTPPPDITQTFRSPTRYVWVNAQMQADGSKDYEAVNALQKQYRLTPLSRWGRPFTPPAEVPVDPAVDTKTPPLEQVRRMDAAAFFGRFARLMKDNPPAPADGPMVNKLKKLGIGPGEDFDFDRLAPHQAKALTRAMGAYGLLEKGVQKLKTVDGWIVMPKNFADYGTDYMTRAGIALIGLGGIRPPDILYPAAFLDADGSPLDGANRYTLHFDKGQTPPARVTWSVSMYDPQGFYVPNVIDRYNLAAWMPLRHNSDGSLDLYVQAESPGKKKEANWLPAPESGPFNLVMRIFWPEQAALDGTWRPPGLRVANQGGKENTDR